MLCEVLSEFSQSILSLTSVQSLHQCALMNTLLIWQSGMHVSKGKADTWNKDS